MAPVRDQQKKQSKQINQKAADAASDAADNQDDAPTAVSFGAARESALEVATQLRRRQQVAASGDSKQLMRARRRNRQEANRLMKKKKIVEQTDPDEPELDEDSGGLKRKPAEPLPEFIPIRSFAKQKKPLVITSSSRRGRLHFIRDPGQLYLNTKRDSANAFLTDRFDGRCGVRRSRGGRDGAQAYAKLHAKHSPQNSKRPRRSSAAEVASASPPDEAVNNWSPAQVYAADTNAVAESSSSRRCSSTPDVLADVEPGRRKRGGSIRSLFPDLDNRALLTAPGSADPADDRSPAIDSGEAAAAEVRVAVRIRPFSQRELEQQQQQSSPPTPCVTVSPSNPTTLVVQQPNCASHCQSFIFDHCLDSTNPGADGYADQNRVYETVGLPLLGKCINGYNACLFAYGMTSSGKTHTVMGGQGSEERGLLPRFLCDLFLRKEMLEADGEQLLVDISYYEIYNEKIHDLLRASHDKSVQKVPLKVREHPTKGPYVDGLSVYSNIRNYQDIMTWLALGNKQRATASTDANQTSSRSHTVCTLGLKRLRNIADQSDQSSGQRGVQLCTYSKVNIVDLAGSERQSLAGTSGERLREGSNINRSLLTLGKVISLLSEKSTATASSTSASSSAKKPSIHLPYRDSNLTFILRDSLGGNSQTVMIATVSPAPQHLDETLSTLRYATKARSIVNLVRVNQDVNDKSAGLIKNLQADVDRLQAEVERLRQEAQQAALLANRRGEHELNSATLTLENRRQALENAALREQLQLVRQQAQELSDWRLNRLAADAQLAEARENCPASLESASQTTPVVSASVSTSPHSAAVSAAAASAQAIALLSIPPSTPLRHRQLSIVDGGGGGGGGASSGGRRLSTATVAAPASANASFASSLGSSPMLAPISPSDALDESLIGLQTSQILLETCFNSVLDWSPADVLLAHLHSVLAALTSEGESYSGARAAAAVTATDPLRCIRLAAAVKGLLHAFPLLMLLDNNETQLTTLQQPSGETEEIEEEQNQEQSKVLNQTGFNNSEVLGGFLSAKWEPFRAAMAALGDRSVALLHAVRYGAEPLVKDIATAAVSICCRRLTPLIYSIGNNNVSTFLSWLATRQCPNDAVGLRMLASLKQSAASRLSKRCSDLRRLLRLLRKELKVIAVGGDGSSLGQAGKALRDFAASIDDLLGAAEAAADLDEDDYCIDEYLIENGPIADAISDAESQGLEGTATMTFNRRRRPSHQVPISLLQFSQRIDWINACPSFAQHSRSIVSHCQQALRYLEILLGGSQLEIFTLGSKCQIQMARLATDLDRLPADLLLRADNSKEQARHYQQRLAAALEAACSSAAEVVISGRQRHQRR